MVRWRMGSDGHIVKIIRKQIAEDPVFNDEYKKGNKYEGAFVSFTSWKKECIKYLVWSKPL